MLKKVLALAMMLALACATVAQAAEAPEYYSAHTPLTSSDDARLNNLSLAAEAIDGARVPTGGGFSFNDAVGPRVEWRGYRRAANGRGAMVTGGGVAQVASTLYLALLQMDELRIDPVRTYGARFADSYVSDPDYAVITDYDAGIDLSFTNLGKPLTIGMWLGDDGVYCSISAGDDDQGGFWTGIDAGAAEEDGGGADRAPFGRIEYGPAEAPACSASLRCGDDADVLNNVTLAAECVNDTTLNSRDIFSFNDIVGPRDSQYGYRKAPNGRGARVTGGGVAQVASAIWLAVKDWDRAAIVEKSTYGDQYNQHYVAHSADAILTDYSAGRDFSFRYTGPGSATIYTWVEDGRLYCVVVEN